MRLALESRDGSRKKLCPPISVANIVVYFFFSKRQLRHWSYSTGLHVTSSMGTSSLRMLAIYVCVAAARASHITGEDVVCPVTGT